MQPTYLDHPTAELFPLLGDEDLASLADSIRANGLLIPILLHEGMILDGRNRYRACNLVGVEPRFREWGGTGSAVEFVVALNLDRRHLNSTQRAVVAYDMLPLLEAEAKARQGTRTDLLQDRDIHQIVDEGRPQSTDQAAKLAGTNRQYVSDVKRIASQSPAVLDSMRQGKVTVPEAKRNIRQAAKAGELDKALAATAELPNPATLLVGSFQTVLSDLDGTVDAIITDPPYPAEFLPLFRDLSELGARILKPGGICAVMAGQSYLPSVMQHLATHLEYHWTLAYLTPGGQAVQLWQRKVNTFWKPVLLFTKGAYEGEWVGDVTRSDVNDNDKRFHHWGQSESGMKDLVERLTKPMQLVVDPFLGAGTTGVAAVATGRRFIGCDIDAEHVANADARIKLLGAA